MNYIFNRLREPSTWVGLIALVGSIVSFQVTPEQSAQISTGLAALAGAILAATKSHGSD